jgi:hypothetical protein
MATTLKTLSGLSLRVLPLLQSPRSRKYIDIGKPVKRNQHQRASTRLRIWFVEKIHRLADAIDHHYAEGLAQQRLDREAKLPPDEVSIRTENDVFAAANKVYMKTQLLRFGSTLSVRCDAEGNPLTCLILNTAGILDRDTKEGTTLTDHISVDLPCTEREFYRTIMNGNFLVNGERIFDPHVIKGKP